MNFMKNGKTSGRRGKGVLSGPANDGKADRAPGSRGALIAWNDADISRADAMPAADLHVLIHGEDRRRAFVIQDALVEAGHVRVTIVAAVQALARRVEEADPDVIVFDVRNPDGGAIGRLFRLCQAVQRPVAMFVDQSDAETMQAAIDAGVSAYVVDGLHKERVKSIVDLAIARFNAVSALRSELAETKQALADRKSLDRAKAILMRARSIGEDEAHHLIRRAAMRENRRMADVARSIVTAASMIRGDDQE